MKIKKIYEVRLDIETKHMFSPDIDATIIYLLNNKYNNKCFKSFYILSVTKIIKRGSITCKNKVLDGTMYVDVMFEAEGIIYEKNEIIHKCKIIQIGNNNIIHAKSEYASIQIRNITNIDIFKENDEIPVIVNLVRYKMFLSEVTISAIPFIP